MKFTYVATDKSGRQVKGKVEALDEREVVHYLRRKNLAPERIKAGGSFSLNMSMGSKKNQKIKLRELMTFTRMIATFIKASVPLSTAMDAMSRQAESEGMKRVIKRLIISVESGKSFAEACREQPQVFDTIYRNMIAAGETSGNLEELLERLADMMERNAAIAGKVKGAMIYPAIVTVVASLAVTALLVFVLPQFIVMFASSGVALPLPTKIVIAASDFLQHRWYVLIGVIGGIFFLYKTLMKRPDLRFKRDTLLLRLPVFGNLIRKTNIARLGRTLGTLTRASVGIIDSLLLVEATTANMVLAKSVRDVRTGVSAGKGIAVTMENTKAYPPMVVSMVAVGESTGGLEDMLNKIAEYYEEDVNRAVEGALKLIEPTMLVLFGGLVLLILLSIYMPMFGMLQVVQESK